MSYKIHRGQDQIGGNIIEIASGTTKILVDIGTELDEGEVINLPNIDGLFNYKGFDAVFISHYHSDHMGLAYQIYKGIPLYIGENSYKIVKASDRYKRQQTIRPTGFLRNNKPIQIGDIKVTPYLTDHSAFDSYMFLIKAEDETILYTGDFRSNGRKSFDRLLKELPNKVDILICEGTTLSRLNYVSETESQLEEYATEIFRKKTGPIFILQSSMNIDRIVTMYRASKRSGRLFLQDLYMAEITTSVSGRIPNPIGFGDVKVFITRPYAKEHFRYRLFSRYGRNKISKKQISKSLFAMCIRSSMGNYLKALNKEMSFENGVLIYSFWSGYKEQLQMKEFLKLYQDLGLEVMTLHTSGHADSDATKRLINHVRPEKIEPIHTENSSWFDTYKLLNQEGD